MALSRFILEQGKPGKLKAKNNEKGQMKRYGYIIEEIIDEANMNESFDYVISFQVIEHIKRDKDFVKEVSRVLRKGGKFIVSTPNAPMSLTRNPWHIREYTEQELHNLLAADFSSIEAYGVNGNEKIMQYYEQNRLSVERIMRYDILDLQHRLPRWILQIPYDVMNRLNRRRLLENNDSLTRSIKMEDYTIGEISPQSFDLYYIATK